MKHQLYKNRKRTIIERIRDFFNLPGERIIREAPSKPDPFEALKGLM